MFRKESIRFTAALVVALLLVGVAPVFAEGPARSSRSTAAGWEMLWSRLLGWAGGVTGLWAASSGYIDPNGQPTTNIGPGIDPNGQPMPHSDSGLGIDPDGQPH